MIVSIIVVTFLNYIFCVLNFVMISISLVFMQDGSTPLYLASQEGHTDVVSVLIDRGATVNFPNQVYSNIIDPYCV